MERAFEIITIGVYGFDRESFFSSLAEEGVECLCDVRDRRGMRGGAYAFANSRSLQDGLREVGIPYLHERSLAPSPALRTLQHQNDVVTGAKKRTRTALSGQFIEQYRKERLSELDAEFFLDRLRSATRREIGNVALFCVESTPHACHRSLIAEEMAKQLGCRVRHLAP
ncbi:MAG: DUF488 domain-containing protein [Thermomicrobiales bacterium]|nr:DUF488 domain-containing protein [Thermomicrobiales bacterium]